MAKTSQHGCAWWLVIGWWWRPIVWLIRRFGAYSKMGVAVSLVSERAIASDALEIANELCKARVRKDAVPERVELDWRPLTQGGKVPKCVLKTTTVWDRSNGDSVIVHTGYLADIEPYTAEVHIWTDGSLDSYKVRVVDGRMQVVNEEGE